MMENGKPRKRRQLSPEEKWEVFLEVTSQQLTQADASRNYVLIAGAGYLTLATMARTCSATL